MYTPIPDTFSKVEVISDVARRRRFLAELKLAVVAETMQPDMSNIRCPLSWGALAEPSVPLEAAD